MPRGSTRSVLNGCRGCRLLNGSDYSRPGYLPESSVHRLVEYKLIPNIVGTVLRESGETTIIGSAHLTHFIINFNTPEIDIYIKLS